MQIDRRITNGLAWAGLFVVVAVPVADAVSGQLMGGGEPQIAVATVAELPHAVAPVPAPLSQRPHAPVVQTAAATPVKPPVVAKPAAVVAPAAPVAAKPASGGSPVDSFLSSGKKLPSYITQDGEAPAQAAAAPSPIMPVPAVTKPAAAPVATASVAPAKPATVPAATPAPAVAVDPIEVATLTPAHVAPIPMPLSMRPKPVTRPLASTPANEDIVLPPEVIANNDAQPVVVDDLRDWESGPLSEFLARRQGKRSAATVTSNNAFPDGFYDEPPRPRRDVYLGPVDEDAGFFPFIN